MKRVLLLPILLVFFLLPTASLADPLPLTDDYSDTITVFYNGSDDADGRYRYTYRYPHADPTDPTAYRINSWYEYQIPDTVNNTIPNLSDLYASLGQNVDVTVSYTVTCNNDEYFSVLIHTVTEIHESDDQTDFSEKWEGNTFSRFNGMPNSLYSLPNLLGILSTGENDEWLETRQTGKVSETVRSMVWNEIRRNPHGLPFDPELPEEDLELIFNPDQDFYLDETGNPVFYLFPWDVLAEEALDGAPLITIPLTLEEIRDEM